MKRFIEGVDRSQSTLFPDRLEDWNSLKPGCWQRRTSRPRSPIPEALPAEAYGVELR